jgi:hypothetical protein
VALRCIGRMGIRHRSRIGCGVVLRHRAVLGRMARRRVVLGELMNWDDYLKELDQYTETTEYWARRIAWALMILLFIVGFIGARLS